MNNNNEFNVGDYVTIKNKTKASETGIPYNAIMRKEPYVITHKFKSKGGEQIYSIDDYYMIAGCQLMKYNGG